MIKKYKIGYTQGVFDMFHIGHLNLIKQAREQCEYLIVGVNSDELVKGYKQYCPIINQEERLEIVQSIRYVDEAFLCDTLDKLKIYESFKFDAVFIGNDWKGSARWIETEKQIAEHGVKIDVVYLNHTSGISSTHIRNRILTTAPKVQ